MIILIDENNGEQWEDYHHCITSVLDVKTNNSSQELEKNMNILSLPKC